MYLFLLLLHTNQSEGKSPPTENNQITSAEPNQPEDRNAFTVKWYKYSPTSVCRKERRSITIKTLIRQKGLSCLDCLTPDLTNLWTNKSRHVASQLWVTEIKSLCLFCYRTLTFAHLNLHAHRGNGFFFHYIINLSYTKKRECSGKTVSHMLTCSPIQQQGVRIRSSIVAERGIFSEMQSAFKDGGRSADNGRWEIKARGGDREGGEETERDRVSWEVNIPPHDISCISSKWYNSESINANMHNYCKCWATWYFKHVAGIFSLNLRHW